MGDPHLWNLPCLDPWDYWDITWDRWWSLPQPRSCCPEKSGSWPYWFPLPIQDHTCPRDVETNAKKQVTYSWWPFYICSLVKMDGILHYKLINNQAWKFSIAPWKASTIDWLSQLWDRWPGAQPKIWWQISSEIAGWQRQISLPSCN